jgi:ubiquinone/menaquinone biosynthesis C-methylase UbiE
MMKKWDERYVDILERNSRLLLNTINYLVERDVIDTRDFLRYCGDLDNEACTKEIYRNESEVRSENNELHPGGVKATLTLAGMVKLDEKKFVLDTGTGHGGAARVLAENFGCKVIGIDKDFVRLCDAIFRTKMLKLDHLVSFQFDNAYRMSFPGSTFDLVFRQHSVYGDEGNESDYLAECHRVLKNNGKIAFHGTFKTISFARKKNPNMSDYTFAQYKELLAEKGFQIIEYESEQSTRELLDCFSEAAGDKKNTNPDTKTSNRQQVLYKLVKNKKVTGCKLVAIKV